MGISTQSPRWGSVMNGSYAKWSRSLKQPFINFYNWSQPVDVVIQWLPCESIIMFSTCTLLYVHIPGCSQPRLSKSDTVLPMFFRAPQWDHLHMYHIQWDYNLYKRAIYNYRLYTYVSTIYIQWDYIHVPYTMRLYIRTIYIYNETIYVPYTMRLYICITILWLKLLMH